MRAEDLLDGPRLGHVAELGAGAVGVDVVDVVGIEPGVLEGQLHGHGRAGAFGMRGGDVVGVGRAAGAEQLGVDRRAALAGVLELFEDEDAGPFAEDEAVAVLVERPAGARRVVVARATGPGRRRSRPGPCA